MKLKEYLEKKRIKHIDFANKIGIKPSRLSRYVNGSRSPDVVTCLKIKKESKNSITEFDHLLAELIKLN